MCHPFMRGLYHKINVICILKIYLWPISISELNILDSSYFEINIHNCIKCIPCHNLSIGFMIKANALKGVGRKCNPGATFAFLGMWRNELTLPSGLPLWELESLLSFRFSKRYFRNQNSLEQIIFYTIGKFLKLRCLKWDHMTHVGT
jgi:hypothetical protein